MLGKRKAIEQRDNARMELMLAEMRLQKYDDLIRKLKRHDYFKFNSGGGIVAYNKGEDEMFGQGYTVPDDRFRCKIVYEG